MSKITKTLSLASLLIPLFIPLKATADSTPFKVSIANDIAPPEVPQRTLTIFGEIPAEIKVMQSLPTQLVTTSQADGAYALKNPNQNLFSAFPLIITDPQEGPYACVIQINLTYDRNKDKNIISYTQNNLGTPTFVCDVSKRDDTTLIINTTLLESHNH